eukprot:scaffold6631_cov61-Phaeocystis_antarctica.AAC.4
MDPLLRDFAELLGELGEELAHLLEVLPHEDGHVAVGDGPDGGGAEHVGDDALLAEELVVGQHHHDLPALEHVCGAVVDEEDCLARRALPHHHLARAVDGGLHALDDGDHRADVAVLEERHVGERAVEAAHLGRTEEVVVEGVDAAAEVVRHAFAVEEAVDQLKLAPLCLRHRVDGVKGGGGGGYHEREHRHAHKHTADGEGRLEDGVWRNVARHDAGEQTHRPVETEPVLPGEGPLPLRRRRSPHKPLRAPPVEQPRLACRPGRLKGGDGGGGGCRRVLGVAAAARNALPAAGDPVAHNAGLARARAAVSGESSATEMTRRRVRAARAAPKSKGSQLGMRAAPAACASESGHAPSKSRSSAPCA